MIYVGIDVAKDKHECFILGSKGKVLDNVFTISISRDGFETLLRTIQFCTGPTGKILVWLEAAGHNSYSLFGFLLDECLTTDIINLLHTNLR